MDGHSSGPAEPSTPLWAWTLSFLRPYGRRVALLATLSLLEIGLGVLAPWPLKVVVDNVLGGRPMPAWLASPVQAVAGGSPFALLAIVVITGLAMQIANQIVSLLHTQTQIDVGQRMVYDLRARLLEHLQGLAMRHHMHVNTGDSVYRLEADAYCIDSLVMSGLFPLTSAFLTLAVMLVVLVRLDPTLALLSLAVVPFLYACLRYYSTRMVDRAERVKELESRLIERLYEIFSAIRVVKSFVREPYELDRFSQAGDRTMNARLTLTWQESLFSVVVGAITLAGTALVLIVGGLHVLRGQLTVGALLVVIAYLGSVYGPLSSIAHTSGLLQQALVSARRVRSIFALTPESEDAPGAIEAHGVVGDIRFEDVRFAYDGGRPILDGISFAAHPGEMVAVVGLTGAGKTTLVSLIPRFYEPTSGRILIDGLDITKYRLRSLRERIALVLQDPVLFRGTIGDNIRYGRLNATDQEVEEAARAAYAHDFVARLEHGYDTEVAEAGGSLSGGERQRVSIARALLKNAPILILDEPTSALDAISEEAVFEALKRLQRGRTTIVIAHRLSTIRNADRILVLHEGRLIAQGTHRELIASNDLYQRMCARLSVGQSLDDPETVDEVLRVTS